LELSYIKIRCQMII